MKNVTSLSKSRAQTIKNRIFSAYQFIIEYNVTGLWIYLFLIFIDFMQFEYLAFELPQDSESGFNMLREVFRIFSYVPYIAENKTIFTLIWFFHSFITLLTISLTVFVLYNCSMENTKVSFFMKASCQILSFLLILHRTIFLFPGTMIFLTPLLCSFNQTGCWQGAYFGISVASVPLLIIHLILCTIGILFNDENRLSILPWASPDSINPVINYGIRIMLALYSCIDYSFSSGAYLHLLFMAILIYGVYSKIAGNHQYYALVQNCELFVISVVLFTSIQLYLTDLLRISVQLEIGIFVLLCSFIITTILINASSKRARISIQHDIFALADDRVTVNAMTLLADLPDKIGTDSLATWTLAGIMHLHRVRCKNDNCICRLIDSKDPEDLENLENDILHRLKSGVPQTPQPENRFSQKNLNGVAEARAKLNLMKQNLSEVKPTTAIEKWKKMIGIIFDELTEAFPKSIDVQLMCSHYHEASLKNYYKSMFQLWRIREENCSYFQQLAVHRMKTLINRAICEHEQSQTGPSIDLDLNIYLKFEKKRREMEHKMHECTQKIMQFWGMLLSVNLKIDKMYLLGGKISRGLQKTHKVFKDILEIFSDHIKTYATYSKFLFEVANNEIEAFEYKEKAEQITRNLDLGRSQAYGEGTIYSLNRETAILVVSGNCHNMSTILHANECTEEVFGFPYNNLVGYSVHRIMPKIIASVHDKFLKEFSETGKPHILNKEILIFGQSKYGLLIPLSMITKTMPGIDEGIRFISLCKRDLNYIKRNMIKLPYQYQKSKRIGFIMTDTKGIVCAISDKAARIFGIPMTYFERKKVLFTNAFNINRLNSKFEVTENCEELTKGFIMDIKTKDIIEMIDKDFLEREDLETLERFPILELYVQLLKFHHSFDLKYYVYIIVPIAQTLLPNALQGDLKDDEPSEDQIIVVENMAESVSSTTSTVNDKLKPLYKELKKNAFEQTESRQIVFVKRIIYLTLLVLFGLSVVDVVYYALKNTQIGNIFQLLDASHYRQAYVLTLLGQVMLYREIALGLEPSTTTFEPDRISSLKNSMLDSISDIKTNEFILQERMKLVDIADVISICYTPGVEYYDIFLNNAFGNSTQGLGITIIQMISKLTRIVNEVNITSWRTPFIAYVFNKTIQAPYKLSQTEKDVFFIMSNILHNFINPTERITDSVSKFYTNVNQTENMLFLILHILRWAVYIIAIVGIIPVIQRVQNGKRAILQFFAEVPKKRIEQTLKECEKFYRSQQLKKLQNSEDDINYKALNITMQDTKAKLTDMSIVQRESLSKQKSTVTNKMSKKTLGDEGEIEDLKKNSSMNEENKNNISIDETQEEESFKEERKKKFMAYKANIGAIILLFMGLILLIAGYQTGIFFLQHYWSQQLDSNHDFVKTIHDRWYAVSALIVFTLSSTPAYQITDPVTNITQFDKYYWKVKEAQESIGHAISEYPPNQASISKIVVKLTQGDFCQNVFDLGMRFRKNITQDWCNSIKNGLLKNGLQTTMFYLITELKKVFVKIISNKYTKENFVDVKLIFEYIMIPAFDFLLAAAIDNRNRLVDNILINVIIHYSVLTILMIIVLIVLIKYFANTLNDELWNAKGIITLLPLDLIEKNKTIRDLFTKQMNVIF